MTSDRRLTASSVNFDRMHFSCAGDIPGGAKRM